MSKIRTYIISFAVTFAVAGLGSIVTYLGMDKFMSMQQPALSPPQWLFPVAWTILYALMAYGCARVILSGKSIASSEVVLFAAQLAFNFLWCVFFFGASAYMFSFIWLLLLLALVILMAVGFYRADKVAGLIQIPYIFWLCFAAYLNFGVWFLNR